MGTGISSEQSGLTNNEYSESFPNEVSLSSSNINLFPGGFSREDVLRAGNIEVDQYGLFNLVNVGAQDKRLECSIPNIFEAPIDPNN